MQIKSEKGLNPFLEAFAAELEPISSLPANSMRLYANALAKSAKLFAVFAEHVTSLGHIQLVRKMIGNELTVRGRKRAEGGRARKKDSHAERWVCWTLCRPGPCSSAAS